jgi:hypothetical protein
MDRAPLSERDARLLTEKIVERLGALGVLPQEFGVSPSPDGFWFSAVLNGRLVTVRTGEGNFHYGDIARELLALSLDPDPWCNRMARITPPPQDTTWRKN